MAEDRNLDLALAALHGSVASDEADDARFAKRIAAGLSNFAPVSRRDLDPVLAAPFPDDHHDVEEFAHEDGSGDDHHAAHAADAGDVRGWEGSMSDDERIAPNSLAGLSGLTRSGPTSRNQSDGIDGAAKGDNSGLIDLRAMSQPPPEAASAADAAPATAAPVIALNADGRSGRSASEERSALNKTTPAVPSALGARSESKLAAAAAPAPAAAAAAPIAATAVAAASPKKKGAGIWIALGGLAAAAAVAALAIPMSSKKSEETTASAPAAPQAADKDKKDEKVAAAPAPSAAPTAEQAPAAASASAQPEPEPAATVAAAPTGAAYGGNAKPGAATPGGAKAMVDAPKAGPDPKQATAAPTTDPIKKPGGGSLDDVLGLGKGNEPAQKKADPGENLPDRPDSMDVRSAINGKVGAARACVKGQDDASSVTVTFGPGGSVSGVAVVSGPAKGTGAETCIKNAFASAKVPPSKKGASGSAVLQP